MSAALMEFDEPRATSAPDNAPPPTKSCSSQQSRGRTFTASSSSSSGPPPSFEDRSSQEASEMGALLKSTPKVSVQTGYSMLCPRDRDGKSRWRRDALLLALGTLASGGLLVMLSQVQRYRGGQVTTHADCASPRPTAPRTSTITNAAADMHQRNDSKRNPSYAFVQMAYDDPNGSPKYLFQAITMARALQRLSRYPLVLLTNTTELLDGTELQNGFTKLNIYRLPIYEVPIPPLVKPLLRPQWQIAYWKLQIWRLVEYDKLIWMDTDAILYRSIDWLFDRTPMYAQKDEPGCDDNSASSETSISGGLLLLAPNKETYSGLMKYAASGASQWWTRGDEQLIGDYFQNVVEQPVRLLDNSVASFGSCLNKNANIPYNSPGVWNVPAFIHQSSTLDKCFGCNSEAQMTTVVDGKVVNACTYHPLGPYWRDLFCESAKTIGVKTNETEIFCEDYYWYRKEDVPDLYSH